MLDFTKPKQVVSTLMASKNASGQKAKVVLVLDRSVSIKKLYDNGTIQKISERILPIGLAMDDNAEIDLIVFADRATKVSTSLTTANYSNFIQTMVDDMDYGGTKYSTAIQAVLNNTGCNTSKEVTYMKKKTGLFSAFSSKAKETKARIMVDQTGKNLIPTLCFFFTDGDCDPDDLAATKQLMFEKSPGYPVFFQFIGLKTGTTNYALLSKMDTMGESFFDTTERFIDNANFCELTAEELTGKSDTELYQTILGEFLEKYVPTAKEQFLIK